MNTKGSAGAASSHHPAIAVMREGSADSDGLRARELQKWDAVAAGWARWWEVIEPAAQPVSDRLVELAGLAPGLVVLDVATGLGEPALTAARRVGPSGRVVATDCAPAMLREAALRAKALGLTNIVFREMDAENPDLDDASFDAILCRWGLMFVPDLDLALRRLRALLRPRGRFAAAAWAAPEAVPFIRTSAAVLAERLPLPDDGASPLNAFRFSEPGVLEDAMSRAGFAEVAREEVTVTYEFASAQDYTRFRRDMTPLDAMLAEHYPPDAVEAAWRAVTEAARAYAGDDGRVRFTNTAVCFSGTR